jgi:hypothetical protein
MAYGRLWPMAAYGLWPPMAYGRLWPPMAAYGRGVAGHNRNTSAIEPRLAEAGRGCKGELAGASGRLFSTWRLTGGFLEAWKVRRRLVGGERRLPADLVDVPALPLPHQQLPHAQPRHNLQQLQCGTTHLLGGSRVQRTCSACAVSAVPMQCISTSICSDHDQAVYLRCTRMYTQ